MLKARLIERDHSSRNMVSETSFEDMKSNAIHLEQNADNEQIEKGVFTGQVATDE